jgi:hypothetical protein
MTCVRTLALATALPGWLPPFTCPVEAAGGALGDNGGVFVPVDVEEGSPAFDAECSWFDGTGFDGAGAVGISSPAFIAIGAGNGTGFEISCKDAVLETASEADCAAEPPGLDPPDWGLLSGADGSAAVAIAAPLVAFIACDGIRFWVEFAITGRRSPLPVCDFPSNVTCLTSVTAFGLLVASITPSGITLGVGVVIPERKLLSPACSLPCDADGSTPVAAFIGLLAGSIAASNIALCVAVVSPSRGS